jgi:hypothetical protein
MRLAEKLDWNGLNLKKIKIAPTNFGCWVISSGGQRTVSNVYATNQTLNKKKKEL